MSKWMIYLLTMVLAIPGVTGIPPKTTFDAPEKPPAAVYASPRFFSGIPELREWLDGWEYIAYMYSGQDWTESFGQSGNNDCDDMAIRMVEDMARDGYIAGVALDVKKAHLVVLVIMGNWFYFVEPLDKSISFMLDGVQWGRD